MANKPIKLKIDVTKLDKDLFFRSEKTGAIYVDLVAWPSANSQYGDTHTLSQSRPMDEPERKMPICGNMTIPDDDMGHHEPARATSTHPEPEDEEGSEIPF